MKYSKKGFTLIELLVVIAIIALLLAIIMPSFIKIKLIVKEVLCKNNIRQYGLATEMYTNDNDEYYPNPWESLYSKVQFSGETRYCRWHNADYSLDAHADGTDTDGTRYAGPYWPYLANTKANVCATFASYKDLGDIHKNHDSSIPIDGPFFSFSMNGNIKKINSGGEGSALPARRARVGNPSGTFLWGEENMWLLKTKDTGVAISTEVLNDNALLIDNETTGYGKDSFGTYHGVSSAEIESELPETAGDFGVYQEKGFTHALLLDGSIEQVRPEDNLRYHGKAGGY